ncbi:hypothetical protein MIMGU_mgv1a025320mg [Erythranthe guttata]|uniref:PAZ domain-containing protein n=1 Tax=Erythranthe guttata TaxID=4155 RepID=A0A022RBK0_ERYGU|nr:hypothetical protein MIMGU_mgv1a025320mg [Erythranthe guttata]
MPKRSIITRPGFGNSGQRISLLANYFKVSIEKSRHNFLQIQPSVYTVGPLPQNNFEFVVVLEESIPKRGMFLEFGEGLMGVRAFDSNFCPTLGGLCLNMVNETRDIDWGKAKKMLKNMRIMASHSGAEFEVIGLSEKPCNQQLDYFVKRRNIELVYSSSMPCLDVGKPTRPNYRPIELCLVSVQRYTKALSRNQRASLVEKLKQNPPDIIQVIAMKCNYVEDHILFDCGISIEKNLTQINGRILDTPKLKVGNNEDCIPKNGPWNFNNKGILFYFIYSFEEDPKCRRANTPVKRVEMMFKQIIDELRPWKKKCLCGLGIVTQCISPTKIDDQYLTHVLLKINSKVTRVYTIYTIYLYLL